MSKYIDLVLVRHNEKGKLFLFQAPAFSHIEAGTEVIVDTVLGKATGVVIFGSITVEDGSDEMNFVATAAGAKSPLRKVLSVVHRIERTMEYDEDEKNESGFFVHIKTETIPV